MFKISLLAILVIVDAFPASTCNHSDGLRIAHQTAFISPISKTRRSRLWMTKRPDPPSIKPPPLEDDILKGDDVETTPLFDISSSDQEAVKEFGVNLSKTYVAPIFSREVVRGVPADIFKGALVSGIGLSVLAGKGILIAGAAGVGVAYVATTPGPTGDSARIVGKVTWSSTQILLHLNKKYEVGKKVGMFLKAILPAARAIGKSERLKSLTERLINDRLEEEMSPPTVKVDDEVTRLVKEAEETVASVQNILDEQKIEEVRAPPEDYLASLAGNISIDAESDILDKQKIEEVRVPEDYLASLTGNILINAESDILDEQKIEEVRVPEDYLASLESNISIDAGSNIGDKLDAISKLAVNQANIPDDICSEPEPSMKEVDVSTTESDIEEELDTTSGLAGNIEDESDETSSEPEPSMKEVDVSSTESDIEEELDITSELAGNIEDEPDKTSIEPELSIEQLSTSIEAESDIRVELDEEELGTTSELAGNIVDEFVELSIGAESEGADESNATPELAENLKDEHDDTSSEPEVSIEDQYIGEDDWEDSIRLAESLDSESDVADELSAAPEAAENLIDEPDVTSRKSNLPTEEISISFEAESDFEEELDAARDLAKSLIDESNDITSEPEMSMEELGKAARAAVDQYEREQQENEIDVVKNEETQSSDRTPEPSQDYNNLTVVKLKDILRSRGLKVTGRKADLILRLKENE